MRITLNESLIPIRVVKFYVTFIKERVFWFPFCNQNPKGGLKKSPAMWVLELFWVTGQLSATLPYMLLNYTILEIRKFLPKEKKIKLLPLHIQIWNHGAYISGCIETLGSWVLKILNHCRDPIFQGLRKIPSCDMESYLGKRTWLWQKQPPWSRGSPLLTFSADKAINLSRSQKQDLHHASQIPLRKATSTQKQWEVALCGLVLVISY